MGLISKCNFTKSAKTWVFVYLAVDIFMKKKKFKHIRLTKKWNEFNKKWVIHTKRLSSTYFLKNAKKKTTKVTSSKWTKSAYNNNRKDIFVLENHSMYSMNRNIVKSGKVAMRKKTRKVNCWISFSRDHWEMWRNERQGFLQSINHIWSRKFCRFYAKVVAQCHKPVWCSSVWNAI